MVGRANPRPSAASARALELLTAAPDMGTDAVLSQLASEELHCSPATVSRLYRTIPAELRTAARISATRDALRRLAADAGFPSAPDAAPDVQPPPGWQTAVHEILGVSVAFISRSWKVGRTPKTRAGWVR